MALPTTRSLESLELSIGLAPGLNNPVVDRELAAKVSKDALLEPYLRSWLTKQGIPQREATKAQVNSLVSAYNSKSYLQAWRRRVNPNWELLSSDALLDTTHETQHEVTTQHTSAEFLKTLYDQIETTTKKLIQAERNNAELSLSDRAKDQIKTLARNESQNVARDVSERLIRELLPPKKIIIENKVTNTTTNLGLQHKTFPKLLQAMRAKDHRGFGLNIWLTGPTGSGKTSACEFAAKALSLPFGSDGSLDADYKVLGFRDANGNIVSTQFLNIYENGGVYVADEIDNWMPSALLSLNAALGNGWAASPRGIIPRHRNAIVIACANTWGQGATNDYVGRTKLDAASLDRFQPKIHWDYDETLERALAREQAENIGLEWHNIIRQARDKALSLGFKVIISPRATFNGIALLLAGFDPMEVVDMTFCAGLSSHQKRNVTLGTDFGGLNRAIYRVREDEAKHIEASDTDDSSDIDLNSTFHRELEDVPDTVSEDIF